MRCALFLICAGIASATFVADASFALILSLICIVVLLFALLLIELVLIKRLKAAKLLRRLVVGLLLISLGACWHLNWASDLIAERLPEILEGKTLQVEGVVIGLPER